MRDCLEANHYFALFGLPVSFAIDQAVLKQAFLQLQKTHHPDQQNQSGAQADLLNRAFDTLHHDDLRALYLLELAGVPVNLDQSIHDLQFLDLMMDSRIVLAESQDPVEKTALHNTLNDLHAQLATAFTDAYTQKNWQIAHEYALKLKFLSKLQDDFSQTTHTSSATDDFYA